MENENQKNIETKEEPEKNKNLDKVKELEREIQKKEEEILRLKADFANFIKKKKKDTDKLTEYIKAETIKKILPVKDELDRCIENIDSDPERIKEAIITINKKMNEFLEKEGIKKVISLGKELDPHLHEAVLTKQIDKPEADNIIIQEMQKGYKFNDKLLRPSKVIVAKYKNLQD